MSDLFVGLFFVFLFVVVLFVPYLAVKVRDKELESKKKKAEEVKITNLREFQKELMSLYKEEYAIGDGSSYFMDPVGMDRVKATAENRQKIIALKAKYPEYEGQYDDSKLHERARYSYGDDVRMLDN